MIGRSDVEALHDLRVSLRRMRSLLRPLRGLPWIDPLEKAAAAMGQLSTPLRDDEVLLQELESLGRPDLVGPRLELWRLGEMPCWPAPSGGSYAPLWLPGPRFGVRLCAMENCMACPGRSGTIRHGRPSAWPRHCAILPMIATACAC